MSSRLERILDGLAGAADGKRRLPVVGAGDAEGVCGLFHAQVDRGAEARARAAAAGGHPVACADKCSGCCISIPVVFAGEALTASRWLDRPEQAEAKARFLEKYPAWHEAVADVVTAWSAAAAAEDIGSAAGILTIAWHRKVMCAFNHEGSCSIYPVRPNVCRDVHALDTADGCQPGTSNTMTTMPFPPLDDYLVKIRPVVLALHAALRPVAGAKPLCVAVHDEIAPMAVEATAPKTKNPKPKAAGKPKGKRR